MKAPECLWNSNVSKQSWTLGDLRISENAFWGIPMKSQSRTNMAVWRPLNALNNQVCLSNLGPLRAVEFPIMGVTPTDGRLVGLNLFLGGGGGRKNHFGIAGIPLGPGGKSLEASGATTWDPEGGSHELWKTIAPLWGKSVSQVVPSFPSRGALGSKVVAPDAS